MTKGINYQILLIKKVKITVISLSIDNYDIISFRKTGTPFILDRERFFYMIKIEIPNPDIVITKKKQLGESVEAVISSKYGFTDYNRIPRDKGGIILFFNANDDLLFVGKARKLRPRIKRHFEDTVSPIKMYRDEVERIAVCVIDDPMEREIYETYIINTLHAKYNIDKVFYK